MKPIFWNIVIVSVLLTVLSVDARIFHSPSLGHAPSSYAYYYTSTPTAIRWDGRLIPADPTTFVRLGGDYGKDKTTVYHRGKPMVNAIASSFHVLNITNWGADESHIFVYGRITLAQVDSFVPISSIYGKDSQMVYFGDISIPDADPFTFTILGSGFAQDANHVYYYATVLPLQVNQTEYLPSTGYIKDQYKVFYWDQEVPADAKTFSANSTAAWDATGQYQDFRKIPWTKPYADLIMIGVYTLLAILFLVGTSFIQSKISPQHPSKPL